MVEEAKSWRYAAQEVTGLLGEVLKDPRPKYTGVLATGQASDEGKMF
jgi:hypothetical protein